MKTNEICLIPIVILLLFSSPAMTQRFVITDLQGNELPYNAGMSVTVSNGSEEFELQSVDGYYEWPAGRCKEVFSISVSEIRQPYYNEFRCDQLASIDTIRVNEMHYFLDENPHVLLGDRSSDETAFQDQLWWGDFLREYKHAIEESGFRVYSCDSLTTEDRAYVLQMVERYCQLQEIPFSAEEVTFLSECYTAGQSDQFNQGTIMTEAFIASQNTPFMQKRAEKYRIVVVPFLRWG